MKLRNLLVDFANHPELGRGIWSHELNNSPPLAEQPPEQREAFRKILQAVDTREIVSISSFVSSIRRYVYNYHRLNWAPESKYQAVNVERVNSDEFSEAEKTIEVRSSRPQKNVDEFLAQIEVLDGRIELNKTRETPLDLNMPLRGAPHFTTAGQDILAHLNYVAEAGIDPKDYLKKYGTSLPKAAYALLLRRVRPVVRSCSRVFN